MKSFFGIAFIIFLSPIFLKAQGNYQPGVAVNMKGDTLHGFINYQNWVTNPKSIYFKPDPSAAPVKLSTNDIKYFSVNVGYLAEYIKYTGPVSMDITDYNKLQIGRDSSYRLDTVFLKVLQKGKNLVLLSHSDDVKTRYFIVIGPTRAPSELIYRVYYNSAEANGQDRTVYEDAYKGQLYDAAVKSKNMTESLKKEIRGAEYREQDIITIASKINGVSSTDNSTNNLSKPRGFHLTFALAAIAVVVIFLITDFSNVGK